MFSMMRRNFPPLFRTFCSLCFQFVRIVPGNNFLRRGRVMLTATEPVLRHAAVRNIDERCDAVLECHGIIDVYDDVVDSPARINQPRFIDARDVGCISSPMRNSAPFSVLLHEKTVS